MAILSKNINNHEELCRTTLKSNMLVWFIFSAIVSQIAFHELFVDVL